MLSPLDRQRLVSPVGQSLALWLNEAGRSMTPAVIFRRASDRCDKAGLDLAATPHALRRTFAVHMLSMLIRKQIGSVLDDSPPGAPRIGGLQTDDRRLAPEATTRLTGQACIASTYVYLDSLDESPALVEAAAERWSTALDDVA
ncbi:hypothetical protein [Inquilinus sp. OTU3971]|uniref:hypothetical protein n=1 Tax=Inquilinus sp. OTU3971 TaxID=3043855 RepID=UPI00313C6E39